MAELKRLASEGRPIYHVEDMHPTGESRLAMRFRLKEEGIDLVGVAILAASDIRMTMRGRHKAYYSKYATLTNSTREESSKIIHTFLQGKFQKSSHKLEQSLGGKDAAQAAHRLQSIASSHTRAGAPQFGVGSQNAKGGSQEGVISDLKAYAPAINDTSVPPHQGLCDHLLPK